ncbi:hypothetical protein [Actinomadura rayongensis]|uniref:YokE-like PH domain-containing protein n=1 Tax=Actinomadura rayongensis TaxID=1429076 RepID=A0A6I4WDA0_9ACTN|nr:hypothetical protein [Actinomadura rayongensis]MXQ67688.1 hypothetical protein [Actinomadura rayongensis]
MNRPYDRSSRAVEPAALDAALRDAIAAHAEAHQLGDVLAAARACCATRSVRRSRPGLLARLTGSGDPDREHTTVALLTPRALVIAVTGERRGLHVRSILLADASVDASPLTAALDPGGAGVHGLWSGATEASLFHLGLGEDDAGAAFRAALVAAVTEAKTA